MSQSSLSDMQLVLLANANRRDGGSLLPIAPSIADQNARVRLAVKALLGRALIAEGPVTSADRCWREEEDRRVGLFITDAGKDAIAALDTPPEVPSGNSPTEPTPGQSPTSSPRSGSKQEALIERLRQKNGATIDELTTDFGWLQPSSAAKQSRRYRYYKSKADGASDLPIWRIPAGELETAVIGSLCAKLQDPGLIHQLLEMGMDDNASIPHVQRSLSNLAATLTDGVPFEKRAVLLKLIDRVDLRDERIDLAINVASLLPSSTNGAPMVQLLTISTPAHLIRAGKEVRLAIPPSRSQASARHDPALIKLIVKSHDARAKLKSMAETPLDDIAQAYGVTRDYFRVLVRLSFLAPDITSAILEGRQPATLTRQLLARFPDLPIEWAAQRDALGFC